MFTNPRCRGTAGALGDTYISVDNPSSHGLMKDRSTTHTQTYSLSKKHSMDSLLPWLLPAATLLPCAQALNLSDVCPPSSIYTPFTKWPRDFLLVPGPTENTACWWWADCVIKQAPEVRKQQFAATSLVMGLVPLILKDIAWPERRIVFVPSPPNMVVEALVRALGLIPVVEDDAKLVRLQRRFSKSGLGVATLVLLTLSLLGAYAALVAMEFFSKRSSLGCPYPLFICTWFIIALVPATIRTLHPRVTLSLIDTVTFITKHGPGAGRHMYEF